MDTMEAQISRPSSAAKLLTPSSFQSGRNPTETSIPLSCQSNPVLIKDRQDHGLREEALIVLKKQDLDALLSEHKRTENIVRNDKYLIICKIIILITQLSKSNQFYLQFFVFLSY